MLTRLFFLLLPSLILSPSPFCHYGGREEGWTGACGPFDSLAMEAAPVKAARRRCDGSRPATAPLKTALLHVSGLPSHCSILGYARPRHRISASSCHAPVCREREGLADCCCHSGPPPTAPSSFTAASDNAAAGSPAPVPSRSVKGIEKEKDKDIG
uniref:Secreted protein n=1 Tax=Oryza meridionalis TaxID=40149 RepID=A0A0E0D5X7_9ORYZ